MAFQPEPPREEALRQRLRAFLAEALEPRPVAREERLEWQRRFAARLYDAGLAAPGWPLEAGGMALPVALQLVHHEELDAAGAPAHPSPTSFIVGPTLARFGTQEQKQRFLRPLLRADELWCQGFSEPGAGSDLTALTTRAVREGDEYVVSGQKLWTSNADRADWMFALVRTGSPKAGGSGITYLLIPMAAPGVVVRPLRDITGAARFAEVFFDAVRVPTAYRVGAEGEGWHIARASLGFERASAFAGGALRLQHTLDRLAELARQTGAARDPLVRQSFARVAIDVRIVGLNTARALDALVRDEDAGPLSSVGRLVRAETEQRLHELALALTGRAALLGSDEPTAVGDGRWAFGYLGSRAATIGAGTSQIQRNTIAERVLGLPRDVSD